MKEIKFRAWDGERMHPVEQWQNKSWVAVPIPTNDGNGGVDWHLEQRKIDDIQLMQYTGLKDKNGKEIFEGDIIEWVNWSNNESKLITIIEYEDDYAAFFFGNWYERSFPETSKEALIIGNIYENPELLDK